MKRPAVFLDRDGTLNVDRGHFSDIEGLRLFPWSADAVRLLNRAGYATVVITNQSGVARGLIDEPFLQRVHAELDARLARGGASIDRYYYCPHLAEGQVEQYRQACRCRSSRSSASAGSPALA